MRRLAILLVVLAAVLAVPSGAPAGPPTGDAACKAVNLRLTAAVRDALRAAHRKVDKRSTGPRVGSTYYGRCGTIHWAYAYFKHPLTGYTDQPEVFKRTAGRAWRDLGDTGGDCGPVPASLTRLWHFDCNRAYVAKKKKRKKVKTQPVSITILAGSTSTLDLGGGNVREIALSGKLKGTAPAPINITKPINIALVGGAIVPAPVNIFDDATCAAGTPLLRTDPASLVTIDKNKKHKSTSVLNPKTGGVTGDAFTRLRIVLEIRAAGCGGALTPTGYADTFARFKVKGKLNPTTGLRSLELNSPPMPIAIEGCTSAGDPKKKCGTKPLAYKGTISVHLLVQVDLTG